MTGANPMTGNRGAGVMSTPLSVACCLLPDLTSGA